MIVFVDFDGTITNIDTFNALVRDAVGDEVWQALNTDLIAGRMTLRDALTQQAAHVRKSEPEALAFLEATAVIDPTFGSFVDTALRRGAQVQVVSSGVAPIIRAALARVQIDVPVFANNVDFARSGWTIDFIDDSANGHDKAARVRAARANNVPTAFIGDGISDYDAAHEADRAFAKRGRALERYCRSAGIPYTPFTSFAEVERALFV